MMVKLTTSFDVRVSYTREGRVPYLFAIFIFFGVGLATGRKENKGFLHHETDHNHPQATKMTRIDLSAKSRKAISNSPVLCHESLKFFSRLLVSLFSILEQHHRCFPGLTSGTRSNHSTITR